MKTETKKKTKAEPTTKAKAKINPKTKANIEPKVEAPPRPRGPAISGVSITKIGKVLGGTHWQADLARAMDYSKSQITKVQNESRWADALFAESLRGVVIQKIADLNALLTLKDLPYGDEPKTLLAQERITAAIALLDRIG